MNLPKRTTRSRKRGQTLINITFKVSRGLKHELQPFAESNGESVGVLVEKTLLAKHPDLRKAVNQANKEIYGNDRKLYIPER